MEHFDSMLNGFQKESENCGEFVEGEMDKQHTTDGNVKVIDMIKHTVSLLEDKHQAVFSHPDFVASMETTFGDKSFTDTIRNNPEFVRRAASDMVRLASGETELTIAGQTINIEDCIRNLAANTGG